MENPHGYKKCHRRITAHPRISAQASHVKPRLGVFTVPDGDAVVQSAIKRAAHRVRVAAHSPRDPVTLLPGERPLNSTAAMYEYYR